MINEEYMKNLVENAFGDIVERTDYGNHFYQIAIPFPEPVKKVCKCGVTQ